MLTDDDRNVDISGDDDADTTKVSNVKIGSGRFMGGYTQKDRPPGKPDKENTCSRNSTSLLPIGERGEEQHSDKSDNVRRYGEKLGLSCQPKSS